MSLIQVSSDSKLFNTNSTHSINNQGYDFTNYLTSILRIPANAEIALDSAILTANDGTYISISSDTTDNGEMPVLRLQFDTDGRDWYAGQIQNVAFTPSAYPALYPAPLLAEPGGVISVWDVIVRYLNSDPRPQFRGQQQGLVPTQVDNGDGTVSINIELNPYGTVVPNRGLPRNVPGANPILQPQCPTVQPHLPFAGLQVSSPIIGSELLQTTNLPPIRNYTGLRGNNMPNVVAKMFWRSLGGTNTDQILRTDQGITNAVFMNGQTPETTLIQAPEQVYVRPFDKPFEICGNAGRVAKTYTKWDGINNCKGLLSIRGLMANSYNVPSVAYAEVARNNYSHDDPVLGRIVRNITQRYFSFGISKWVSDEGSFDEDGEFQMNSAGIHPTLLSAFNTSFAPNGISFNFPTWGNEWIDGTADERRALYEDWLETFRDLPWFYGFATRYNTTNTNSYKNLSPYTAQYIYSRSMSYYTLGDMTSDFFFLVTPCLTSVELPRDIQSVDYQITQDYPVNPFINGLPKFEGNGYTNTDTRLGLTIHICKYEKTNFMYGANGEFEVARDALNNGLGRIVFIATGDPLLNESAGVPYCGNLNPRNLSGGAGGVQDDNSFQPGRPFDATQAFIDLVAGIEGNPANPSLVTGSNCALQFVINGNQISFLVNQIPVTVVNNYQFWTEPRYKKNLFEIIPDIAYPLQAFFAVNRVEDGFMRPTYTPIHDSPLALNSPTRQLVQNYFANNDFDVAMRAYASQRINGNLSFIAPMPPRDTYTRSAVTPCHFYPCFDLNTDSLTDELGIASADRCPKILQLSANGTVTGVPSLWLGKSQFLQSPIKFSPARDEPTNLYWAIPNIATVLQLPTTQNPPGSIVFVPDDDENPTLANGTYIMTGFIADLFASGIHVLLNSLPNESIMGSINEVNSKLLAVLNRFDRRTVENQDTIYTANTYSWNAYEKNYIKLRNPHPIDVSQLSFTLVNRFNKFCTQVKRSLFVLYMREGESESKIIIEK